jgi:hypothetical protein
MAFTICSRGGARGSTDLLGEFFGIGWILALALPLSFFFGNEFFSFNVNTGFTYSTKEVVPITSNSIFWLGDCWIYKKIKNKKLGDCFKTQFRFGKTKDTSPTATNCVSSLLILLEETSYMHIF